MEHGDARLLLRGVLLWCFAWFTVDYHEDARAFLVKFYVVAMVFSILLTVARVIGSVHRNEFEIN